MPVAADHHLARLPSCIRQWPLRCGPSVPGRLPKSSGRSKARIHLHGLAQLFNRLVVASSAGQGGAQVGINYEGEWVELQRAPGLRDSLLELAEQPKSGLGIPLVGGCVVRIQFNRAPEFTNRFCKIES